MKWHPENEIQDGYWTGGNSWRIHVLDKTKDDVLSGRGSWRRKGLASELHAKATSTDAAVGELYNYNQAPSGRLRGKAPWIVIGALLAGSAVSVGVLMHKSEEISETRAVRSEALRDPSALSALGACGLELRAQHQLQLDREANGMTYKDSPPATEFAAAAQLAEKNDISCDPTYGFQAYYVGEKKVVLTPEKLLDFNLDDACDDVKQFMNYPRPHSDDVNRGLIALDMARQVGTECPL